MQSPTLEQFLQLIFFPGQYQMKLRFNTELRHYRVLYDLKMEIKSSNKRKTDRPKEDREIYLTPRPCIVVSFRFPTPTRKESETRALLNSTQHRQRNPDPRSAIFSNLPKQLAHLYRKRLAGNFYVYRIALDEVIISLPYRCHHNIS